MLFKAFNVSFFVKQVFYRERLNGHYGVSVFVISNFISSFPFLVAIAASTGSITFYMVKFRPGFSYYAYFCMNIFLCIAVVESCMMVVASLVPNFLMGIVTGAGLIVRKPTQTLTLCLDLGFSADMQGEKHECEKMQIQHQNVA